MGLISIMKTISANPTEVEQVVVALSKDIRITSFIVTNTDSGTASLNIKKTIGDNSYYRYMPDTQLSESATFFDDNLILKQNEMLTIDTDKTIDVIVEGETL